MSDTLLSSDLDSSPLGQNTQTASASFWAMVLIGIGIGVFAFFMLGYNHILPPGRVDWLLRPSLKDPYYDPSTEFMGWHFFRRAPWTFPLGLNRNYGIEFGGSVVYSDSIPLLAILFKPFSHWMGTNFQYIGIWILICFIMQGVFGALLASIFTKRIELKAIVAMFFALSPILLERGRTEYPLMGHWLLLWALYLYFRERTGRIRWVWLLIALLATTTSFYFVPMILLLWGAEGVKTVIWRRGSIGWVAVEGAAILATVLLAMWTVGYFAISVSDAGTVEFGKFATNLLGPIDPMGRSLTMVPQDHGPHWLGEGFCYFGFGVILLGAIAVHELLRTRMPLRPVLRMVPLGLVLLGLAFFSLSNEVALGSHEWDYPNIWGPIGRMFRASARMCWPGYYAAWLGIFYLTTRSLKRWPAAILLAAMLAVQVVDYKEEYASAQRQFRNRLAWQTPLISPFWNLAVQKYQRIIVVPSGEPYSYVPIAYLAANHNLPTNGVYVSRYPSSKVIGPISDRRLNALLGNQPNPDNIYIIPDPYRFAELVAHLGKAHGVGLIDGYHVIAPNWIADGEPADGLAPGGKN
jgi:Family of unknown function (DUF6311)